MTPSPENITSSEIRHDTETSIMITKALSDSNESPVWLLAPDFTVLFFNKAAHRGITMLYGREPILGESMLSYALEGKEADLAEFKANVDRALEHKTPVLSEREMHYPSMSFWVRSEFTPVSRHGEPYGVLYYVHDISARKQYETITQKQAQALDQIAWMQSHLTRQPLATMLGLINILDKPSLTTENRKIIDLLEETAQKLEQVIQQTVIKANLE